jgi:hypothetical protein
VPIVLTVTNHLAKDCLQPSPVIGPAQGPFALGRDDSPVRKVAVTGDQPRLGSVGYGTMPNDRFIQADIGLSGARTWSMVACA